MTPSNYNTDAIAAGINGLNGFAQPTPAQAPVVTEEVKAEGGEAAQEAKPTPEAAAPVVAEDQLVPEVPVIQDADVLQYLAAKNIGISSFEEIKQLLETKAFIKQYESEYKLLSDEEKGRLAVAREYGDYTLYDRVTAINLDAVSDKEALRVVYMFENQGKSPELLNKLFEREYASKYENADDEELVAMLLKEDAKEVRGDFKAFQEEIKAKASAFVTDNTDEDQAQHDQRWFEGVDAVLNEYDRLNYEMEGGIAVNIVMDHNDRQTIQDIMDRPIDYINSLITGSDGKISHELLFDFVLKNFYFDKAMLEARAAGESYYRELDLKQKKNVDPVKASGAVDVVVDPREQIADGINRMR